MRNSVESPVLFLTYRRFETATQVFSAIRSARPSKLYFASNAASTNDDESVQSVNLVRGLLAEVDWPCEVKTLLRERHLDVKESISSAIDWFFEHEEEGIILEDDCLPHPEFFKFCDRLLDDYRDDRRVASIGGVTLGGQGAVSGASYRFSDYPRVWGWATWRRTWLDYDVDMSFWPQWKKSESWGNRFRTKRERQYWTRQFDATFDGAIATWDYQLVASMWAHRQLAIAPNVNLVSNIGFGEEATFTKNPTNVYAGLPSFPIFPLTQPEGVARDQAADQYDFDVGFNGSDLRMLRRIQKALRRLYHWVKGEKRGFR